VGRPDQKQARRAELLPIVAAVFAELGYRRTTTAALAERCAVQETILYRLWPDKRAMFVASIEHVVQHAEAVWSRAAARAATTTAAEAVLEHEAVHLGEFGLYRILFAGLSETDDADVAEALRRAYRRFHAFLLARLREHRDAHPNAALPPAELSAWALIGLGTVVNLGRELELLPKGRRADLLRQVGRQLLGTDHHR
jgi:AcrR family transcriptional regulator